MNSLDKLIGLVAPNVCLGCGLEGSVLCTSCIDLYHEQVQPRCAGCIRLSNNFIICKNCKSWLPLKSVFVCSVYEGMSEKLIKSLKFEYKRQSAASIAHIMSILLRANTQQDDFVICPIPTAPARIRERGFDHAFLIAKQLSELTGLPLKTLLSRQTNVRQLGSSRRARIDQMSKEFKLKKLKSLPKKVLLVDDVMTTGATLSAAAKMLKNSGIKEVSAIVYAQKL